MGDATHRKLHPRHQRWGHQWLPSRVQDGCKLVDHYQMNMPCLMILTVLLYYYDGACINTLYYYTSYGTCTNWSRDVLYRRCIPRQPLKSP